MSRSGAGDEIRTGTLSAAMRAADGIRPGALSEVLQEVGRQPDPAQAQRAHQPLDGAPGHRDALTVELVPHLRAPYRSPLSLYTRRTCFSSAASRTARAGGGRARAA